MSDMKCPFCQQELLLSSYRDDDTAHQMWSCLSCQLSAQRKIWQELIRTRKALEIAVDALKDCEKILKADRKDWGYLTAKIALNQIEALAEITALEQKENNENI